MDFFDFFSMAGEIAEFFKAAGEDIGNLFKQKRKTRQSHSANEESDEGWTPDERRQAHEPWDFMPIEYWQELMKEKLEEKEQIDKQIIEDYEARHAEPEENTESGKEFNSCEQDSDSRTFESDFDSDGSSSDSSGYVG